MDGIHDMGGMHGFGKVEPEPNEPVFHAPWEGRSFALNRAMGYTAHLDHRPDARRHRGTAAGRLFVELLLQEMGVAAGKSGRATLALPTPTRSRPATRCVRARPLKRKLTAAEVPSTLTRGSFARPAKAPARFKPGDRVRTKNIHPATHTRLPRYARGRIGVIEALRGCHVFPDTAALGNGEDPQWLYTVLFEGRELWGETAEPSLKVSIEAFEPYLEPA